ncbi:hypothetical protein MPTK1_7g13360 [Marchantia polymorpha subsp. ruderalis]|uniref:Tubulin epsilon and delta complex protein 1 domain-containing protein n=2 Tax=Marchantia polymorpha TaxID=3197 RepID=A0A176WHN8_MARPO|nr:hypothetical protein AXG93_1838s1250 [Marchantia polymorpha subsp. ruderalis]PTQ46891.1 hypothetical protein MARPO_0009s0022 [Marchantia polymorpha]BBN17286.1 hypothetical protein Mp_7g13360 [Marchantia polymorpha subsp. ruderalis]|eukprot:PTQ46891.1 hypothetical protein MARPO_0009s0022 [Marchantia polymorpha]
MGRRGVESVSESLAYLCSLVRPLGLHDLCPQSFLLAAANHPSASASIWSSLHQLICLQLAFPSSSISSSSSSSTLEPVENVLASRGGDDILPEDVVTFVKFYLSVWGYSHSSPIFYLSYETEESQSLLLALAWLISRCDIFKRALQHRLGKRSPPPFPATAPDVSKTSTAAERGRQARARSQNYVDKLVAASDKLVEVGLRARARSQQCLLLFGRVRMSMMTIHALVSTKATRMHKLNQIQLDLNIKNQNGLSHSQFDLLLLEDKEALESHFRALEAMRHVGQQMEQCEKHEIIFWQWMVAVLLHRDDVKRLPSVGLPSSKLTAVSEFCSVCIPSVLKVLRQQLANEEETVKCPSYTTSAEALAEDHITGVKDLSSVEEDNERVSNLIDYVHSHSQELMFVRETALTGNQCPRPVSDAESIVERFKYIATALLQALAQIRIQNRICIEDAMSPYATEGYILQNF